MKKIFYSITAIALTASIFAFAPKGESFKVSSKVSSLEWTGKKVTGQHNGTIQVDGGEIMIEDGKIVGGMVSIDMNTIAVTDIKDEEMNGKLKGHLMSDDFFGVANHPKAMLKITSVEDKGDKHHIHGEITIKGKTEKVEIPATITMDDKKVVAIGTATLDRTKFDIKYGSGKFFEDLGDKMIYDDFEVKFKVGAMK